MSSRKNLKDIKGQRFGYFTVLERTERKSKDGMYYWKCRCDCGYERDVLGANLRASRAVRCSFSCPINTKIRSNNSFHRKYVKAENGCWIWTGLKNRGGYGKFCDSTAHRISYEKYFGSIPEGMCVCHTCDNRACVNPDHLWIGTTQENTADKMDKNRHIKGETHGRSKLKDEDILNIRKMRISGSKQKEICEKFKISRRMVALICHNKSWNHVPLGEESKMIKRKY